MGPSTNEFANHWVRGGHKNGEAPSGSQEPYQTINIIDYFLEQNTD